VQPGHYDTSSGWRSAQDGRFCELDTVEERSPMQVLTSPAYAPKNVGKPRDPACLYAISFMRNAVRLQRQGCSWCLRTGRVVGIITANKHNKTHDDLIYACYEVLSRLREIKSKI
jgi:hypothetical protein